MIPSIEDIFHSLHCGEMSFDDAEKYVRAHIDLASGQDNLRDVFAAMAMTANVRVVGQDLDITYEDIAKSSYCQADAMLKERAK